MNKYQINKTIQEINAKIRQGKAVVVTAEEIIPLVKKKGPVAAAKKVDVVTTGTFSPMCSSGAFLNFGQSTPTVKASSVWINGVPAYAGLAAVDIYMGATEPAADDPLNKVYPGEFKYGGGHVIQDLIAGRKLSLRVQAYGTDCYPNKGFEKEVTLADFPNAVLMNPRNCYQNYNCAINLSNRTIYTYMGTLRARGGNANYATSGQLSPLMNDPYYKTMGLGTRIFLGGAQGHVIGAGTQHNPDVPRTPQGVPKKASGTLMVMGNLKEMSERWLTGVSIQGYGCSMAVGVGIPIPILNEDIASYTGVSDDDILTQIVDYGHDYSNGIARSYGEVSYAQLRSGKIMVNGKQVPTAPLSSYSRAKEIAEILKGWILEGKFLLGEPQNNIPASYES